MSKGFYAPREAADFDSPPDETVSCAFSGCQREAKVRLPRNGWVSLCLGHYETVISREAKQWCAERGLEGLKARMDFCRSMGRTRADNRFTDWWQNPTPQGIAMLIRWASPEARRMLEWLWREREDLRPLLMGWRKQFAEDLTPSPESPNVNAVATHNA
jgi:hypothetical protein